MIVVFLGLLSQGTNVKSGHSDRASEEQLLQMEEALKETIPKFFVSVHNFSVSNLVTSMASFICSIFFCSLCLFGPWIA